ncbi:hypothetical protein CWI75_17630 [Kineobactrum sediminis]|uniref:Glycosyltransferase 2-like domain-containing protein n=1 Tax=Kineobactrum sediminis TaxID=1905677 RepID=A0A2N5XY16_9GAMM|nr:glycosyltransferase family 2 protein [Kineobactrum sediminis]PLW80999.1 hypothetical protein CWI75_17630 [Kineobactrum sediminis]
MSEQITHAPTVTSIVVTYYPEASELTPLLERLLQQTDRVILVDNTPGSHNPILDSICAESIARERCIIIRLQENLGIAEALNTGCERARELGTDFFLLSDQDSLPDNDMVAHLLECYRISRQRYGKVAAVGPTYTDLHTGLTYPFQTQIAGRFFYSHTLPTDEHPYIDALSLITSGTLIPVEALSEVGPMRQDLFMDYVDIEWCMRAKHLGFKLIGCGSARMSQRLGESSVRVWYFGWRNESLYGPLRLYYRLRNFVALTKDPKINWRWKIRSSWYSLGLIYTHLIYSNQRRAIATYSVKGITAGFKHKMGKYS